MKTILSISLANTNESKQKDYLKKYLLSITGSFPTNHSEEVQKDQHEQLENGLGKSGKNVIFHS